MTIRFMHCSPQPSPSHMQSTTSSLNELDPSTAVRLHSGRPRSRVRAPQQSQQAFWLGSPLAIDVAVRPEVREVGHARDELPRLHREAVSESQPYMHPAARRGRGGLTSWISWRSVSVSGRIWAAGCWSIAEERLHCSWSGTA